MFKVQAIHEQTRTLSPDLNYILNCRKTFHYGRFKITLGNHYRYIDWALPGHNILHCVILEITLMANTKLNSFVSIITKIRQAIGVVICWCFAMFPLYEHYTNIL